MKDLLIDLWDWLNRILPEIAISALVVSAVWAILYCAVRPIKNSYVTVLQAVSTNGTTYCYRQFPTIGAKFTTHDIEYIRTNLGLVGWDGIDTNKVIVVNVIKLDD